MTETPIYDQLVKDRFEASIRKLERAFGRIADIATLSLTEAGVEMKRVLAKMDKIPTAPGGSSSQEVSASSASRHSLPDSSRPGGSMNEGGLRYEEEPVTGWVRKGKSYRVGRGVIVEGDWEGITVNGRRFPNFVLENMPAEKLEELFKTGRLGTDDLEGRF